MSVIRALVGALVLWPIHILNFLVLGLIGFVVVPLASSRTLVRLSKKYAFDPIANHVTTGPGLVHQIVAFKDKWVDFIYGNEEDGVDGAKWFRDAHPEFTTFRRIVQWSAFRNPTNNIRFNLPPPFGGIKLDKAGRDSLGNSTSPSADLNKLTGLPIRALFWHFTYQGWYSGIWIIYKLSAARHLRLRLGWKIPVELDLPPIDYRTAGCGFALQFTPYRRG